MSYFLVKDEVILAKDEISSRLLQLEKLKSHTPGSELVALFLGPKDNPENQVVVILQKDSGKWKIIFPNEKVDIEGLYIHKVQVLHYHGMLYPWTPLTEADKDFVAELSSHYSKNPIDFNILEGFGLPITTKHPNDFSIEEFLPFRYTFPSINTFLIQRIKTELSQKYGIDFITYPVSDENVFWFYDELKRSPLLTMISEKMAYEKRFDLILALGSSSFLSNFTSEMADNIATSGNLEMMKYLESKGIHPTVVAIENAGYSGSLDMIKYLMEKGFPVTQQTFDNIVSSGNVDLLRILKNMKSIPTMIHSINAINSVIRSGKLEMLIYLIKDNLLSSSVNIDALIRLAITYREFGAAKFLMKTYGKEAPYDLLKKIVFGEDE